MTKTKKQQCCVCNSMFDPKDLDSFRFKSADGTHKVVVCLECKKNHTQEDLMEMALDV